MIAVVSATEMANRGHSSVAMGLRLLHSCSSALWRGTATQQRLVSTITIPSAASAAPAAQPATNARALTALHNAMFDSDTFMSAQRLTQAAQLLPIKALLVDAAGTLLSPSEPAAAVYLRYAAPFGVCISEAEVLRRFRTAYNSPWRGSSIRYVGDGRPFWHHIVTQSTGCDSVEMFEQIYDYYGRAEAWTVTPGAAAALLRLRRHGIKLAVVSNFDTRLRPLMDGLGLTPLFDQIIVSAEVGVEKPCPLIFEEAVAQLGLEPHEVVHLGDDRRNDVWGARDAGITAWLWGADVGSFEEVADKVLTGDRQI